MAGYRPAYTVQEDTQILNIIIKTESYYQLKGVSFWKDCGNLGALDRPWMSIQNRFFKYIIHNIDKYNIPLLEKRKIQIALFQCSAEGEACLEESKALTASDDEDSSDENNACDEDHPDADEDHPDADEDHPDADEDHPDADEDHPDADEDHPDADEDHCNADEDSVSQR